MPRLIRNAAVCLLAAATLAHAVGWELGEPVLIHPNGRFPNLRAGAIAFTDGNGGAVIYYDGTTVIPVFGPDTFAWEPVIADGTVAWRNSHSAATSNEIYLWDGAIPVEVTNLSNSPGISDSDLSGGANGDLLWSRESQWLTFYDASTGFVGPTGIRGAYPSLFVKPDGTVTYAYQDPDTLEIKYFDGTKTHTIGLGAADGAAPALWDGMVAWIGDGEGGLFTSSELYCWKGGELTRVTNDDAVGGVADNFPSVWGDKVIWSRNGPWDARLFIWDGVDTVQLNFSDGKNPSYHAGQVAWVNTDGMYLTDVNRIVGDCTADGVVDLTDHPSFVDCLSGPAANATEACLLCFDVDESGTVDLADYAVFAEAVGQP